MAQETMVAHARPTWREVIGRSPMAWKVAVAIGVLGWFFSAGGSTTTTINGVADCDGFDIGPLVVAAVVGVLAVVGVGQARREHPDRRLPVAARWTVLGLLAAVVAVHVVRVVLDPAGRAC
jgi:hypothetical protein